VNNSRDLDALLRVAGGDPYRVTPNIADFIQPVYVLDDLRYAVSSRAGLRLHSTPVPSVAVGEASAIEFITTRGVWVRRAFNVSGANLLWFMTNQVLALTTTDIGGFPVNAIPPDGSTLPVTSGQMPQYVANNAFGFPSLLSFAAKGRQAAPFGLGVAAFVNNTAPFLQDVWIPQGWGIYFEAVALNLTFVLQLDLQFPAESFA